MAKSAVLNVSVLVDAAKAASELAGVGQAAESMGSQFAKVGAAIGGAVGIVEFGKKSVEAASALEQSMGGVEAVFKGSAGTIKKWGAQAADSVGLSQSSYQDLATLIGSQLKNAGVAMEDLAPKTDELIRQGADMAAMYGGTTADAVGALSSALKGERDPIEKYGVTLSQAAVDAEIMALGLDTTTTAAKQAATATATMSLITKQSADSHGAAAREADSYASVMQRLGAVWENTLAAVGTALLPALSSLGTKFADMAPAIGSILTPIAELAGWLLELPTPILAIAAGFALWKFTPIGGMISGLAASMQKAVGSAAGFKTAMADIGRSLAGGALIGGAMLIFSELASTLSEAKAKAAEFENVVSTLGDELVKTGGKAGDTFAELQRGTLENTEAFKALTGAGISYGDAMNFFTDQGKLSADAVSAITAAIGEMNPEMMVSVLAMTKSGEAAQKYAQGKMEFLAAEEKSTTATGENTAATKEAEAAKQKEAEATAKQSLEAAKAAAAQTTVKLALDSVKSAASQAQTAVDFFVLSMQAAAGMNVTADQAAKALNDSLRNTADAFKASTEKGNLNSAALTTWNVAVLTSTSEGSALYDSLIDMQTGFAASTTSAYDTAAATGGAAAGMAAASAAADSAYNSFIKTATGAGLTADQAAQLAAKLGIVQGTNIDPKTFDLIAQDRQADQAVAEAQAAQIDAKTFDVTANVKPATDIIAATTAGLPEATIKAMANTKPADASIAATTGAKYSTTVETQANITPAASMINQLTGLARNTTIQVLANTSNAINSINAVATWVPSATIQVMGNTRQAMDSINAVVNGHYTATIVVTANVSQATAAIAAIPRSVGVSAPPPTAPAVPALMAGGRSSSSTGGTANVNYTINLTGGITDPAGAARAIRRVLQGDSRRAGGVIAR